MAIATNEHEEVTDPLTARQQTDPNRLFARAIAAHREKNPNAAIALLQEAIVIRRGQPLYYFHLGNILRAAGHIDDAAKMFAQCVRLQPALLPAQFSLAMIALVRGRHEEGRALFSRCGGLVLARLGGAFRKAPAVMATWVRCWAGYGLRGRRFVGAQAHLALGLRCEQCNERDLAITHYRRALRRKPNDAGVLLALGKALSRERRYSESLTHLSTAFSVAPDDVLVMVALGEALARVGRIEEGDEFVDRALSSYPISPQSAAAKGWVRYLAGDANVAAARFHEALAMDPDCPDARIGLGRSLLDLGRTSAAAVEFERAADRPSNTAEALRLWSQVGRAKPMDKKFQTLERALARPNLSLAERVELHFSAGKMYDDIEKYDQAFHHYQLANDLFDVAFDPTAYAAEVSALIATYTPELLAHGRAYGLGTESPVFIVGMPRAGTTLVEQILSNHPNVYGAGELGTMTNLTGQVEHLTSDRAPYPDCASQLDEKGARLLAQKYMESVGATTKTVARFTDKMPKNFLHLGLIALLLPRARIIHVLRDPMDTCLSIYFTHFLAHHAYAYNLTNLGHYYNQYQRLMAHWQRVLPLRTMELRYEELVADQVGMSRKLVEFCGLEWDERCLSFYESDRAVHTTSGPQVRQPMYVSSVGRWRRYESHLTPLIDTFCQSQENRSADAS